MSELSRLSHREKRLLQRRNPSRLQALQAAHVAERRALQERLLTAETYAEYRRGVEELRKLDAATAWFEPSRDASESKPLAVTVALSR